MRQRPNISCLGRASRWRRHRRGAATLACVVTLGLLAWSWRPAVVQRLGLLDPLVSAGLSLAYGSSSLTPAPPGSDAPLVVVQLGAAVGELDPRFLSVALDTSQIVGGRWWSRTGAVEIGRGARRVAPFDLARPELVRLARALAPAYLRVGGTEADHVYYGVERRGAADPASPAEARSASELPAGYELELSAPMWDALAGFAGAADLDLMFTLNAGPGPRSQGVAWEADNAEALLRYARSRGDEVAVWELGNEVNGYWFIHGLDQRVSGAQYAADVARARELVRRWYPDARLAGPGSLYWPVVGEPVRPLFGMLAEFLEQSSRAGAAVDIISWHFYPQQSRRCPVATRRASPERLLEPSHLDELGRWANEVTELRDRHVPEAEVWLGETGNAQCGGEPGVSDRFVASLWWLDELGLAARRGQAVVVRQTLAGSDYGLLDDATLEPRPDYFASLLWKRLMGPTVLDVSAAGDPFLRLYAHCAAGSAEQGSVVVLAINTHAARAAAFVVPGVAPRALAHHLTAPSLDSRVLELEGHALAAPGGVLPELVGTPIAVDDGIFRLAPASAAFFALEPGAAPACAAARVR
jgi:heparanase